MFVNETKHKTKTLSRPTEGARLRAMAPVHDWTGSTRCQELNSMLSVLGESTNTRTEALQAAV